MSASTPNQMILDKCLALVNEVNHIRLALHIHISALHPPTHITESHEFTPLLSLGSLTPSCFQREIGKFRHVQVVIK